MPVTTKTEEEVTSFTIKVAMSQALTDFDEEQVRDLVELITLYAADRDPEIVEAITELFNPDGLGKVIKNVQTDEKISKRLNDYQAEIGKKIKLLRVKKEWSQEQLAAKAGIKQSHVSRLEGGIHTPSDLTIQKLADALGVHPGEIDPGMD